MATKKQLKAINDAAIKDKRQHTIDPNVVDGLPDDGKSYLPVKLLAGPGGTW